MLLLLLLLALLACAGLVLHCRLDGQTPLHLHCQRLVLRHLRGSGRNAVDRLLSAPVSEGVDVKVRWCCEEKEERANRTSRASMVRSMWPLWSRSTVLMVSVSTSGNMAIRLASASSYEIIVV